MKEYENECTACLILNDNQVDKEGIIKELVSLIERVKFIGGEQLIYDLYGEKAFKSGDERMVQVSHELEHEVEVVLTFNLTHKTLVGLAVYHIGLNSPYYLKGEYIPIIKIFFEILDSKGIIEITNESQNVVECPYCSVSGQ